MPINNADNTNQETKWDSLWVGVNLACMSGDSADSEGKNCNHNSVGIIMDAAIAIKNGRIAWLGKADQLASEPYQCAHVVHDGNGQWLTPGLIDCHTHLVFAGNRAAEFEQRLNGVSYADIAKAGGGIRSTVAATRAASEDELLVGASQRIAKLCKEGVTTIEIKSGYGLSTDHECRMLKVAKSLQALHPVNISTTFLGAHAIPQEYQDHRQAYVDLVCNDMLPKVAEQGLADAVDAFCETVGFSLEETRQIFSAAKELGLPIKLHADQLSDSGGGALAAEFGALSADHIEYAGQESVKAMAKAGTVGVLLPGAYYFLRETQLPPIEHLRAYNVPMAIASDANPGSSPTVSLLLMLNMACTMFHLTPSEALAGVTINAAKALGLEHDRGSLDVGKRADLALWDVQDLAELCYWIGNNPCTTVIKDGQIVEN